MAAALDLVAAAEAAVERRAGSGQGDSPADGSGRSVSVDVAAAYEPFVWRQSIMRPAVTAKQVCRAALTACPDMGRPVVR